MLRAAHPKLYDEKVCHTLVQNFPCRISVPPKHRHKRGTVHQLSCTGGLNVPHDLVVPGEVHLVSHCTWCTAANDISIVAHAKVQRAPFSVQEADNVLVPDFKQQALRASTTLFDLVVDVFVHANLLTFHVMPLWEGRNRDTISNARATRFWQSKCSQCGEVQGCP